MAEREILIDHLRLSYEGLFSVPELYKLIDDWLRDKGYDKKEIRNFEAVLPESGKRVEIVMEPWKKFTDYVRCVLKLRIIMDKIKEVEIEKDGFKAKINQGSLQIIFDGFFETDYENSWEAKPFFFFMRSVMDKFIYKSQLDTYRGQVVGDVNEIHGLIKSFLNLYRY